MNHQSSLASLLILSSLTTCSYAISQGYYGGMQIGSTNTNLNALNSGEVTPDIYKVVNSAPGTTINTDTGSATVLTANVNAITLGSFSDQKDDKVLSGRIYVGYQLMEALAFELGYFYIKDQTLSYTSNSVVSTSGNVNYTGAVLPYSVNTNAVKRTDTYSESAIDFNAKAMLPLNPKFYAYAKVGLALMKVKIDSKITLQNPTNLIIGGTPESASWTPSYSSSTSSNKVYPTLGIGCAYSVTDNMDLDLSWYRVMANNNNLNNINTIFGGFLFRMGG